MRTDRFRPVLTALCALTLLGAAACRTTPKGQENNYTGAEGSMEMGKLEGNQLLAKRLEIVNPRSRRLDDGRLQVQFDLHNTASHTTEFAWTANWFDASGFQVEGIQPHYQPEALGAGAFKTLTLTAPTPQAASWRLGITSRNEVQ